MIALVNTGVANVSSVLYALERIGAKVRLTSDAQEIANSERVILPGVGTAMASMANLRAQGLDRGVAQLTQPVLGICLGMQLVYQHSLEGSVDCLGVFPGVVRKMEPAGRLPIPHIGWNQVTSKSSRLLKNIPDGTYFYFVHSFQVPDGPEVKAWADYGGPIPAIVESGNWFGTQFHPERSGAAGEQVLRNFLSC